ncbi:MAG TPA: DUF72 domain-containing protein [Nitrososphaera sp.]
MDSSFYHPPNLLMTKRWASMTPDNFRFTAKFPRAVTHEKRLTEPEKELHYFFDVMRPPPQGPCTLATITAIADCKGGLEEAGSIDSDA